jgi:hypothetical protein
MMVLLRGGVEGPAKIAMTPLLNGSTAVGLLPNDGAPEAHFSWHRGCANLLILNWAAEPDPADICQRGERLAAQASR